MHRNIKFRFWHKEDKQFFSPWARGWRFEGENGQIYVNGMNVTDRAEIIQSTGLKDCNDVEIYGGYILHFTEFDHNGSDTQYTGVVKFAMGMWQIWNSWDNEFWGSDGAFHLFGIHSQDDGIEVIGNVFEHPHLLPKEEEQA